MKVKLDYFLLINRAQEKTFSSYRTMIDSCLGDHHLKIIRRKKKLQHLSKLMLQNFNINEKTPGNTTLIKKTMFYRLSNYHWTPI